MNIKTDGSIPSIKNQYGLTVPCYIISFFNLRDEVLDQLEKEGIETVCNKNYSAAVYERLFKMYFENNNEEHPIQKCKTEQDLCELRLKDKYNSFKKRIEKKGSIFYEYPEMCILQGFIPKILGDTDEDKSVRVYETNMTFDDGYATFDLDKSALVKMLESLS